MPDGCGRVPVLGDVLGALGQVAVPVVGVDEAVPPAAGRDVPEQRRGLAFAGQPGELVDRGDDERGCEPVDLLVDGEHRQAVLDGAAASERARAQVVTAVDVDPSGGHVDAHGPGVDGGSAPGAALDLQDGEPVAAALGGAAQLLVGLVDPLGRHVGADPEADPERLGSPGRRVVAAGQLGGADERRRALELLRREQAQGVPHEHGDAAAAVERAVRRLDHPLPAPDRERVCRQAQVRLGLAATGGEEEQLDLGRVARAAGQRRAAHRLDLQQDERDLEGEPRVGLRTARQHLLPGRLEPEGRLLGPQRGDLGGDPLLRHDLVHEPEAPQRLGVRAEERQALGELLRHGRRLGDRVERLRLQVLGQAHREVVLGGEPLGIPLHDG